MVGYVARALVAVAFSCVFFASAADAGERQRLGFGRLLTNDYLGDGKDRWRTGSWTLSGVWGSGWTGQAPSRLGDLIELRLSSEIFAPDNIAMPSAGDRPYAGALSVGAHTHFEWQGLEAALGADLVVTGAGTGLGRFQHAVHKALGVRIPSRETLDQQIAGGLHPTLVGELGRDLTLVPGVQLRPFLEGRAGAETLVRAGFDLTFGTGGVGGLLVRESVSGQRYRIITNDAAQGLSFTFGADIAQVTGSVFLPQERGYDLTASRDRVRVGLHWQGERAAAFYGLTYLGKEFEAQKEGQIVGSIRLNLSF